ncbi:MAG: hypothetical protein HFI39_04675 [Lachnospiraceae bacterium]|nr:hypothetical protein [Lachnospiraceae bacterium]
MDKYFLEDVQEQIINNESLNFIAYAVIPLHVIGINAIIRYLNDNGYKLRGYIYIITHHTTGKHISENDFSIGNNLIKIYDGIIEFKNIRGIADKILTRLPFYNHYNCSKRRLFFAVPSPNYAINAITAKCNCVPHFIQYDDGYDSYVKRIKSLYEYKVMYTKNNSLVERVYSAIKSVAEGCSLELFIRRLKKNKLLTDFRMFSDNSIEVNPLSIKYYMDSFKNSYTGEFEEIRIFERCILFNTQCLMENNITDGKVDLEIYKEVVAIAKSIGCEVVVKPHPREHNVEKYINMGCKVYAGKYTQESILASLRCCPSCIVSIHSSTLINAKGLFNIPVISLGRILLQRDISDLLRRQISDYIKQYSDIVLFPESIEELTQIIKVIVLNNSMSQ